VRLAAIKVNNKGNNQLSSQVNKKFQERKRRALHIAGVLRELYPNVEIPLTYKNNWELLVSVVLSAQTTDKKVNEITAVLFKKYKSIDDYIKADLRAFERDIREIGLYRAKAKNILTAARIIKEIYKGELPHGMDEMTKLPGIGRKSANIILGNAYGIVEGIAVDTHVRRFALKFDLTDSKDPNKIEQDLMKLLPKKEWFHFTYRLIKYGRTICPARKHNCLNHPLTKIYAPAADRWISSR
jgi:endonuclease-3